jgi:hypothetical protein
MGQKSNILTVRNGKSNLNLKSNKEIIISKWIKLT